MKSGMHETGAADWRSFCFVRSVSMHLRFTGSKQATGIQTMASHKKSLRFR